MQTVMYVPSVLARFSACQTRLQARPRCSTVNDHAKLVVLQEARRSDKRNVFAQARSRARGR